MCVRSGQSAHGVRGTGSAAVHQAATYRFSPETLQRATEREGGAEPWGIGWRAAFDSLGGKRGAGLVATVAIVGLCARACACVHTHTACQQGAICDGRIKKREKNAALVQLHTDKTHPALHMHACR